MDSIATFILAVLGTNVATIFATSWVNRRREAADVRRLTAQTNQLELVNEQSSVEFYRTQVKETIAEMVALRAEVKDLKVVIEKAQTQYERRVGSLHEQLDNLATELRRANTALDKANVTISELHELITKLQDKISQLLADKAETEKENLQGG